MNILARLFWFLLTPATLALADPATDPLSKIEAWNRGHPGGIAVVLVDDAGPRYLSAGRFSGDDARAVTPDTVFEIGSLTKVFTAVLLAREEDEGLVKETDSAPAILLPEGDASVDRLKNITLLSLATHTAGLPRLPSNLKAERKDPYSDYSLAELLAALRRDGEHRSSDRATSYSNFGVALLGQALGKAAGADYEKALETKVLAPLGMERTRLNRGGRPQPEGMAPGHNGGVRTENWTFDAMAPAGGLLSSARELGLFLQACLGPADAPVKKAIRESLRSRGESADLEGQIGLIWRITGTKENHAIWHNGMTGGYASFAGIDPATRRGVAILTNHADSVDALGFELLGVEPAKPRRQLVANASDFVGRYPLSPAFALDITENDSALFVQATSQAKLALGPLGPDRFQVKGIAAELRFSRDGKGRVEAVALIQNGRSQKGKREPLPGSENLVEIELPEKLLEEYEGVYTLAPGADFVVTRESGKLWVKLGQQARFRVYASAKDEFFYRAVEARLSFVRDEGGRVVQLVLHQAGRDMPAPRSN